jgi:hypothetical protein
MTNNNNGPTFLIENGRLYTENETDGLRQVTHVRRLDAGGEEYLKLWMSGGNVHAGRIVGDTMFTLTLGLDGRLEGKVPGGYQYNFVAEEKGITP